MHLHPGHLEPMLFRILFAAYLASFLAVADLALQALHLI
jgi:hypothetical protein